MKKIFAATFLIFNALLVFAKPQKKESHTMLEATPLFDTSETQIALPQADFSFTDGEWFIKAISKGNHEEGYLVEVVEIDFSVSGEDFKIAKYHANSAMTYKNLSSEEASFFRTIKDCIVEGNTVTIDSIYDEKALQKKSNKEIKDLINLFYEIIDELKNSPELNSNEEKTKFYHTKYIKKNDETEDFYIIKK